MPDYRSFYDKDFIGAWDLHDGDKTITIIKCIGGSLTAPGGRKSKKPVVYFQGSEKGFALNATNGKTISSLYGNMVENWPGKSITLYKSMTRSPQGDGDVECIRVRPNVPSATQVKASKSALAEANPPPQQAPAQNAEGQEIGREKSHAASVPKGSASTEPATSAPQTMTNVLLNLCKQADFEYADILSTAEVQSAEEMSDEDFESAKSMLRRRITKRMVAETAASQP